MSVIVFSILLVRQAQGGDFYLKSVKTKNTLNDEMMARLIKSYPKFSTRCP